MTIKHQTAIMILLILTLTACTLIPSQQLVEDDPTMTVAPMQDLISTSTLTPTLSSTLLPVDEPEMGTPVPDWEGIPIMPGANEGRPAGYSYVYSVSVSIEEVEEFYQQQMENANWMIVDIQRNENTIFGGPGVSMDFENGEGACNIMLMFSTKENYTIVSITRMD